MGCAPIAVVLAVLIAVPSCTGGAPSGTAPTGAVTPSASGAPRTEAELVIAQFKAQGLRVGTANHFLAGYDPNPPLGIPGSYAGATWYDRTLQPPAGDTAVGFEDGGTIEVFTTQADRETRQKAFSSLPTNAGTVVGRGPLLLLLSPLLAPAVVARYEQALQTVPLP